MRCGKRSLCKISCSYHQPYVVTSLLVNMCRREYGAPVSRRLPLVRASLCGPFPPRRLRRHRVSLSSHQNPKKILKNEKVSHGKNLACPVLKNLSPKTRLWMIVVRKFSRKADIPTGDFLSRNLLFVAFGLNYEKISEGFDHHTNPTLKKFVLFRAFRG